MEIVVLGAGLMGKEIARDLVNNDFVKHVILAGINLDKGQKFVTEVGMRDVEVIAFDAQCDRDLREVMGKGTVVINALSHTFNERVARAAIDIGVHVIDLGGYIGGATEAVLQLHEEAAANNITIIPDLGTAPGIVNILTAYGVSQLDHVESIKLYAGGIPTEPKPPLHYTHVFSLESVFDHYTEPSEAIQKGELTEVESLSGIEPIYFEEFGVLEAFYTSGGASALHKSFPNVKTFEYKTIRYKGHAEKFKLLVELGFLDKDNIVNVDGADIAVRTVVREAIRKKLELGKKVDAVLLRAIIVGEKNEEQVTYEYEMVVQKDLEHNISALARSTSSAISAVVKMLHDGTITKRGVYPPELIVPGDVFMKEMSKRDIVIKETCHYSATIVKW